MARLAALLEAYLTHGAFFAALHFGLVLWTLVEIRRFTGWAPRLGSWEELEARADYIRGIVGLFLVVGVAGTFFGLYEVFLEANPDATNIWPVLKKAGAKAVPVGFVGLMLSLAFSAWVDILQKEKAKTLETIRAWTLEELVKAATLKIEARLRAIEDSLGPIAQLEGTLSLSLQPVIRELGGSLEGASRVLQEQGDRLEQGKTALIESSTKLGASADTMAEAVRGLSTVAEATKKVVTFVRQVEERSAEVFLDAARGIEQSVRAVVAVGERAQEVMTTAGSDLRSELQTVPSAAALVVESLRKQTDEATKAWTDLRSQAIHLAGMLKSAQEDIESVSRGIQERLPAILERQLSEATQNAAANISVTFAHLRNSVHELSELLKTTMLPEIHSATHLLDRVRTDAAGIVGEAATRQILELGASFRVSAQEVTHAMSVATVQLTDVSDRLAGLAAQYKTQPQGPEYAVGPAPPGGPRPKEPRHEPTETRSADPVPSKAAQPPRPLDPRVDAGEERWPGLPDLPNAPSRPHRPSSSTRPSPGARQRVEEYQSLQPRELGPGARLLGWLARTFGRRG